MDVIATHRRADWGAIGGLVLARRLYPNAVAALPEGLADEVERSYGETLRAAFLLRTPAEVNLAEVTRLILIDASRAEQIGVWAEVAKRPDVEVHIYSRHPATPHDLSGDLEARRGVGSCVTLFAELIQKRELMISPNEATWALIGLHDDTGGLSFATTTADDLRAAAWLLDRGANTGVAAQALRGGWSAEQLMVLQDLLQASFPRRIHGLDLCWAELAVSSLTPKFEELAIRLHHLRGAQATIVLLTAPEEIRLIVVSEADVLPAASLAQSFGGDGTPRTAQAALRGLTLGEARERILRHVRDSLTPIATAAELMQQAPTVAADCSVKEAGLLLLRNQAETAPVVDADLQVVGVVDRLLIDRALQHDLGSVAVTELIDRQPVTCLPDTDLIELHELFKRGRQRILPVTSDSRFCGIVRREDVAASLIEARDESSSAFRPHGSAAVRHERQKVIDALSQTLPAELFRLVQRTGKLAAKAGVRAFLVGGFVRDLLLHRPNLDVDIVVEGDAIALARQLAEELGAKLTVHDEFLTATLALDEIHVDLAGARREYYPQPAALPVVTSASADEDVARRDFTINTLLLRLDADHFGEILDFHGGRDDLRNGVLRVLHGLSFIEDPTRIFRAVRFEKRFGFHFDEHTLALLRNAIAGDFVQRVSGRRIWKELRLIVAETDTAEMLERLIELGVLGEARHDRTLSGLLRRTSKVLTTLAERFPEQRFDRHVIWLAVLLSALPEADARSLMQWLELPRKLNAAIQDSPAAVRRMIGRLQDEPSSKPSAFAAILRQETNEVRVLGLILSSRDDLRRAIHRFWDEWEKVTPLLDGRALRKLGLPGGPLYAEVLAAVL